MSAAEAVKKAVAEISPDISGVVVDSYRYASAFLRKVATDGYLQILRFLPQLYSFFYDLRDEDPAMTLVRSQMTRMTVKRLRPLLKELAPDLLVCTHAFPSGVAARLKEELGIPVVNIVTDFAVHP